MCEAYEKAAKGIHRKGVFPPRKEWQPPFLISTQDRELMCGPQQDVTILKRQTTEDSKTKSIVFISAESENVTLQTKCSYIAIYSDSG